MQHTHENNSLIEQGSTVLIIEDDRMVSTLLKSYFEKANFIVHQIYQGELAEISVHKFQPDLIILDIGLPDIDGFQVCGILRESYLGPIMMLTSHQEEQEQINGFYSGADDYVIKPVSPSLLKVRAEALIRRYKEKNHLLYNRKKEVGNLRLDPNAHKCYVGGQDLKLSTFEFKLLNLLVDNTGKVMSRDRIYNVLLRREYNGTERTVDVRMAKLREKLDEIGLKHAHIETVWGEGYVLNEVSSLNIA
ncbi:response regulator transcription factor [Thalassotalea atypica]|uniref:response regulator transcription factor n=1 Tax=Thalassotalea atypica TaxID=2054316 RepID=UPI00257434E5|nr:response regulator transcription factor [Thalassotalea atypica]